MKLGSEPVNWNNADARYGARVRYVHIKDLDGGVLKQSCVGQWSFERAQKNYIFAPLGEGIARVPDIVETLKHSGYDGWLVIEQDTMPLEPTVVVAQNRM
jgi:inosose dehydratase